MKYDVKALHVGKIPTLSIEQIQAGYKATLERRAMHPKKLHFAY